jgi:hypothetical protein
MSRIKKHERRNKDDHLIVEEKLPGVVALEEEVQMVQHGGIVEHEVHDLMTEQPAELQNKNNNKINNPLTSALLIGFFINLSLTVQAAF